MKLQKLYERLYKESGKLVCYRKNVKVRFKMIKNQWHANAIIIVNIQNVNRLTIPGI